MSRWHTRDGIATRQLVELIHVRIQTTGIVLTRALQQLPRILHVGVISFSVWLLCRSLWDSDDGVWLSQGHRLILIEHYVTEVFPLCYFPLPEDGSRAGTRNVVLY